MKLLGMSLSIAAGLLGGAVSPYIFGLRPVHAQAQAITPKMVEAGSFRLVSETGRMAGTITINPAGIGVITMYDADGKVVFTSENKAIIKPAAGR